MHRWLWLSGLVVLLDQGTKALALTSLTPHVQVPIIDGGLYWMLTFNEGAAFSFLANAGGAQRWILSAFALAMSVALAVWLLRLRHDERLLAAGLALVIGGAVGNLIDRVLYGHVVDFIQVYLPFIPLRLFNPWPAFNIADSAISIGVTALLLTMLRNERAAS
jgi:signal peptidase II